MKNKAMDFFKREEVFPYRLKAAYTVEAAAVMGICMIFMGVLFMGGFQLYGSAMDTLSAYEESSAKPQDIFRLARAVGDIVGG